MLFHVGFYKVSNTRTAERAWWLYLAVFEVDVALGPQLPILHRL